MDTENQFEIPVIMTFAGNDPTGGAGIQADIESISSMGGHAAAVVTALTIQDTQNVLGYMPVDLTTITEQARAVLEDMPVSAIKIGMVGSVEAVEVIHSILMDYPDLPVVFDPILSSGGGEELADGEIQQAMLSLLAPLTTVITPNSLEARILCSEADNLDACAHELMDFGCEYVLITGSHENTEKVVNTFYGNSRVLDEYTWERLPQTYHGSGCTLSASIAALLAQGIDPLSAVHEAQEFTWQALKNARRLGMGQYLPNRYFWAQNDIVDEEKS